MFISYFYSPCKSGIITHIFKLITPVLYVFFSGAYASSSMSSYPIGPRQIGGEYHMLWMWRNSELASTNHSLSYAKSKDLINWKACEGISYKAPINFNEDFIIEKGYVKKGDTLSYSGLLNSRQDFSIINKQTIVSYVVNNEQGTQLVNATVNKDCSWNKQYVTNNCEFINLNKYGTLPDSDKIKFTPVYLSKKGYSQKIYSSLKSCDGTEQGGLWLLNKSFAKLSLIKSTTKTKKKHPIKFNKTIKTKSYYIQWKAKQNNGDTIPSCLFKLKCKAEDFFTRILISDIKNSSSQNLYNHKGDEILAWGGSKANYSAIENGEFLYLSYFNENQNFVVSKILAGKILETIVLAEANDIWDSHNNLVSIIDDGNIFISGNIHNNLMRIFVVNLNKFSLKNTIEYTKSHKVSYPRFFKDNSNLKIMFRVGKSGNGDFYFASLNEQRLFDFQKLFSN